MAYARMGRAARAFGMFPIVDFPLPAILRWQQLFSLPLNVGSMDLKIAAIALELDAAVVTRNVRDFRREPGLRIEDWSA